MEFEDNRRAKLTDLVNAHQLGGGDLVNVAAEFSYYSVEHAKGGDVQALRSYCKKHDLRFDMVQATIVKFFMSPLSYWVCFEKAL